VGRVAAGWNCAMQDAVWSGMLARLDWTFGEGDADADANAGDGVAETGTADADGGMAAAAAAELALAEPSVIAALRLSIAFIMPDIRRPRTIVMMTKTRTSRESTAVLIIQIFFPCPARPRNVLRFSSPPLAKPRSIEGVLGEKCERCLLGEKCERSFAAGGAPGVTGTLTKERCSLNFEPFEDVVESLWEPGTDGAG